MAWGGRFRFLLQRQSAGSPEERRGCSGSSSSLRIDKVDDKKTDPKRERLEKGKWKKKRASTCTAEQCGLRWVDGSLASGTELLTNTVWLRIESAPDLLCLYGIWSLLALWFCSLHFSRGRAQGSKCARDLQIMFPLKFFRSLLENLGFFKKILCFFSF